LFFEQLRRAYGAGTRVVAGILCSTARGFFPRGQQKARFVAIASFAGYGGFAFTILTGTPRWSSIIQKRKAQRRILQQVVGGKRMAKAATHVLGADIGTRYIKVVELRRQGSDIVLGTDPVIVPTPEGAVDGGQVVDSKLVAEALRYQVLKKARFGTRKTILAVAGDPMVIVRVAEMARLKGRDLEDAIKFEINRHSQFPIEELYYDYAIVEAPDARGEGENMEVLLAAAHEEAVNAAVKGVMDARLQPVGVDVLPLAVARASLLALGEGALSQTLCCVSIGSGSTFIVMVRRGMPNFVRFLPTGGETFTDAVRGAGIADRATAENVKRLLADVSALAGTGEPLGAEDEGSVFEVSDTSAADVLGPEGDEATLLDVEAPPEALDGEADSLLGGRAEVPGEISPPSASKRSPEEQQLADLLVDALEQPVTDLATEIRRSIDFYRRQHRNEPVDRVVLSGGGALITGFDTFLASELGTPVVLCNPFANMVLPQSDEMFVRYLQEIGPIFSSAVGLAARDMIESCIAVTGR
jgi:type IV pilus assembly protein PilM